MLTAFIIVALAQSAATDRAKVTTVCEVLGNPNQYRDSVVAVVGRLRLSMSLIDSSEILTEDRCGKPIVTKGFVWRNEILIWSNSGDELPKAPTEEPNLDKELVAKQLAVVRQTTKLGVHREPRITMKDGSTTYSEADVPNQWVVVYGRVIGSANLSKEPCAGEIGCRGFMGAPMAIIVERKNIHPLNEDGTLQGTSDKK